MLRPSVLLVALAMASPVLWQGLTDSSMDITTVLLRFLIAVPIAAVLLAIVRLATPKRSASTVKATNRRR
jgi:hypothetical protein